MPVNKSQSALREVRDQLLLDYADSDRLTAVTDNLGFNRPSFGFSNDDQWRALARELALGPRQIELAFRKILEICVGPDFNRCAVISEVVAVGDTTVTLEDASELVQFGSLTLSPGQAGEETIDFCFVDRATNKVFLESPTTSTHAVQVAASTVLNNDVAVGATTLVLANSEELPTTYPYSICLGRGTLNEESVTVTNNATATNILTVSATVNAHEGFKADYVRSTILNATVAGRTFLVFDLSDTENLPETGWIRLDANSATLTSAAETYALVDAQTLTVDVDGGGVQTATFNTADFSVIGAATAAEVALVITEDIVGASAADVGGTVVITAKSTGASTTLEVTGGTANGVLGFSTTLVAGTDETVFYNENSTADNTLFLETPLANAHAALGTVELLQPGADVRVVSVVQSGVHWSIFDTTHDQVKVLVPESLNTLSIVDASWIHDPVPTVLGSTTLAVATTTTDTVIELASAEDFPDEAGMLTIDGTGRFFYTLRDEDASPNPTLTLTAPAGAIYGIGTTVALFEVPYATTLLEEGNPRNVSGTVIADRYPGPYVYDPADRSVGITDTTITTLHPPTAEIQREVLIGRETIECDDLSLWDPAAVLEQARIGAGTGFEEDLTVTDVTLVAHSLLAVVASGGGIGTAEIVVDTALCVPDPDDAYPETVGTNTAWFTIIIDEGGGNEETVIVSNEAYDSGTDLATFTISRAWTTDPLVTTATFSVTHAAAETVRLVNDVLTVDATTRQHFGPSVSPTVQGHPVGFLTDTISLTSAIGFSTTGGYLILNFGNSRLSTRSRLNTIVRATGDITMVAASLLAAAVDTDTFVLDDGVNPAVTFAFDDDSSVVESSTLRAVNHTGAETATAMRDLIVTAINAAPTLAITASPATAAAVVDLVNDAPGVAGNVTTTETVVDAGFLVSGMAGGVAAAVYQFDDTSDFPTTDFPYQIVLSQGTEAEELISVSANDTGLNQLTFSSTPVNIHATGPAPFGGYAAFVTGDMEIIEYQDVDTNDIILNPAQVIDKHTIGEVALTSVDFAIPRTDGFSYPFYLPPDLLKCVKDMFEVVRAAGIQVTIITF